MLNKLILVGVLLSTTACKEDSKLVLTTSDVTDITSTTAVAGGNIIYTGSEEITARGVCWGNKPRPDVSGNKTTDGSGSGTFTSLITGLSANSKYYLRAYATRQTETFYGDEKSFTTYSGKQIIADHRAVDNFSRIPDNYIAEVKKMLLAYPGESHSYGIISGLKALQRALPQYTCNTGTGEMPSNSHLRVNSGPTVGEAEWFTWYAYPEGSRPPAGTFIKNLIRNYHDQGHPIHVLGFGWCWDMVGLAVVGGESKPDPVYGCKFWGLSEGGPDGNRGWGLDEEDYMLSGNKVSLNTYLQATQEYIKYCTDNGYITQVIFTTGPVDGGGGGYFRGEIGYQGYLKNEKIREYVRADDSRILFDYADILSYDDDGTLAKASWNGHSYPVCTAKNEYPVLDAHISAIGELRLAKAMWWMLARMAGWDGTN